MPDRLYRTIEFSPIDLPGVLTSLSDILTALSCFEFLYLPISAIDRLAFILGDGLFSDLIRDGALRFIWWNTTECLFPSGEGKPLSHFATMATHPKDRPVQIDQALRTFARHRGHRPKQARILADLIDQATTRMFEAENSIEGVKKINSLLAFRNVREVMGLSPYTPVNETPKWLDTSALRLATLVRAADAVNILRAGALKLPFPSKTLAGALFSTTSGGETSESAARYVIYGTFAPSPPPDEECYRQTVRAVLRFRGTSEARQLRSEVLQSLTQQRAADCVAAIDAGLHAAIPTEVLQRARDVFCELLLPQGQQLRTAPALWQQAEPDGMTELRQGARKKLRGFCDDSGIGPDDPCPCGSNISLAKCCLASLR